MIETISKLIKINKPNIIDLSERTIKDYHIYNYTYRDPLDEQLGKMFSEAYSYFCNKNGHMLGRDSWMDNKIKPTKRQYIYEFWELENIEKRNFSFTAMKGKTVGILRISIQWIE